MKIPAQLPVRVQRKGEAEIMAVLTDHQLLLAEPLQTG
jgi:hypothetical protein